jgi:ArsR family transcriptional regulator
MATYKEGSNVYYSLASPCSSSCSRSRARSSPGVLSGQVELLEDLRTPITIPAANADKSPDD